MMRVSLLIASLFLLLHGHASADVSRKQCEEMIQAWVLNGILEELCEFGGALHYKLGVISKNACGSIITEADVARLSEPVLRDFKADYDRMGSEALCEDQKAGYAEAVKELIRLQRKQDD